MGTKRSVWSTTMMAMTLSVAAIAPGLAQSSVPPEPSGSSPVVAVEPALSLGVDTLLFRDTFDEPLWGVQERDTGSVGYSPGALTIKVTNPDSSLWSWREWSGTDVVVRVDGAVTLGFGQGIAGYLCGSGPSDFVGGLVNPTEWLAVQIVENHTTVLARGPLPTGVDPGLGDPVSVAVECAVTGPDNDRILVSVEGSQVADVLTDQIGPFDWAAVFAYSSASPIEATFDDVSVYTGATYAPSMAIASAAPITSPSPRPQLESITSLGADTLLHTDTFDDETMWVVGETSGGSVAYDDGTLGIDILAAGNSLWTWDLLSATHPVIGAEGSVTLDGQPGAAGWTCGTSAPDFVLGIVNPEEWVLGTIIENTVSVLDRGRLPDGIDPAAGEGTRIAVECAQIADDATRVVMWVDGVLVGDATTSVVGPFDRVGAYADVDTPPLHARFDDLEVTVGAAYRPAAGDAAASDPP